MKPPREMSRMKLHDNSQARRKMSPLSGERTRLACWRRRLAFANVLWEDWFRLGCRIQVAAGTVPQSSCRSDVIGAFSAGVELNDSLRKAVKKLDERKLVPSLTRLGRGA